MGRTPWDREANGAGSQWQELGKAGTGPKAGRDMTWGRQGHQDLGQIAASPVIADCGANW